MPGGKVALALPGNAILSNPVATVLSAALADNDVTARLPGRRRGWTELLRELLSAAALPATDLEDVDGASFLTRSFWAAAAGGRSRRTAVASAREGSGRPRGETFLRRDGPRINLVEFSAPRPRASTALRKLGVDSGHGLAGPEAARAMHGR